LYFHGYLDRSLAALVRKGNRNPRGGLMNTLTLRRMSVWLDDLAPEGGAFAHALEWAKRFDLPLCGLEARPRPSLTETTWQACAAACSREGIPWSPHSWETRLDREAESSSAAFELAVLGIALPPGSRNRVLRETLGSPNTLALVCPRSWRPLARVLVLHDERDPESHFLESVISLCRVWDTVPVVLSVARSEPEARSLLQFAEDAFARERMPALFDLLVGENPSTAAAGVARWRSCTHVFVRRQDQSGWRRWLRGDPLHRLLGLADSLALVSVPGANLPDSDDRKAKTKSVVLSTVSG
jgi:hypothetical protein